MFNTRRRLRVQLAFPGNSLSVGRPNVTPSPTHLNEFRGLVVNQLQSEKKKGGGRGRGVGGGGRGRGRRRGRGRGGRTGESEGKRRKLLQLENNECHVYKCF